MNNPRKIWKHQNVRSDCPTQKNMSDKFADFTFGINGSRGRMEKRRNQNRTGDDGNQKKQMVSGPCKISAI